MRYLSQRNPDSVDAVTLVRQVLIVSSRSFGHLFRVLSQKSIESDQSLDRSSTWRTISCITYGNADKTGEDELSSALY
jgi:hypothetical protein